MSSSALRRASQASLRGVPAVCAPHWRLPKVAGNLSTSISLGPSTMSAPDCARRPFCSSSTTKKARGTGGSRHKGKNKAAQATVDEEDTEEQAELQQEVLRLEEQPGFIKGGRMRDYQVLASYRGSPALARKTHPHATGTGGSRLVAGCLSHVRHARQPLKRTDGSRGTTVRASVPHKHKMASAAPNLACP